MDLEHEQAATQRLTQATASLRAQMEIASRRAPQPSQATRIVLYLGLVMAAYAMGHLISHLVG